MATIIWREWYNEAAVKQLTEFGTLPRYEAEVDTEFEDGEGVARLIAKQSNEDDSDCFRESGEKIVILEPQEFAGTYEIHVEYCPEFSAYRDEDDE